MGNTTQMLIAVDSGQIAALTREVEALRRSIEAVRMEPRPDWITLAEYAERVGRSPRTVRAWIAAGRIDSRRDGNALMVRAA